MSESIECIRNMLENHGIAYTTQREEILSLFITDQKHYKPDEIYRILRSKGIGIATVYRTLELLKNCDILKEINIGKEHFYELKKCESKCVYVHFKCEDCGVFQDYFDTDADNKINEIIDAVEHRMESQIYDVTIMVSGLCNRCR